MRRRFGLLLVLIRFLLAALVLLPANVSANRLLRGPRFGGPLDFEEESDKLCPCSPLSWAFGSRFGSIASS